MLIHFRFKNMKIKNKRRRRRQQAGMKGKRHDPGPWPREIADHKTSWLAMANAETDNFERVFPFGQLTIFCQDQGLGCNKCES